MAEQRYVEKDGLRYACQRLFGRKPFRCGKCLRGLLYSWYPKCKVCGAKLLRSAGGNER